MLWGGVQLRDVGEGGESKLIVYRDNKGGSKTRSTDRSASSLNLFPSTCPNVLACCRTNFDSEVFTMITGAKVRPFWDVFYARTH